MSSYSKIVWEHFHHPQNVGRIDDADAEGRAGGRYGGPFMAFSARVKGESIDDIRFQTYGCAPAIAAGSFLTHRIKGKSIEEASHWNFKLLLEALGGLPEDKHHCAQLAIEALKKLLGVLREKGIRLERGIDLETRGNDNSGLP